MDSPAKLLKEQIERIEGLKHPPAYNPQYGVWNQTTEKIIRENFDKSYYDLFRHAGPNRMAMNDAEHYQLFLETLEAKKQILEELIKEHERFSKERGIDISRITALEEYDFHPEIKSVSQKLFEDGHFAQAVEEAFKRVINEVKEIVKASINEDLDGNPLMNRAFGFEKQKPIIKFNSLTTRAEQDEQRGIMFLFKGIVNIRHRKAHDNVLLSNPQRAVEYLALASLLMRLLDEFRP